MGLSVFLVVMFLNRTEAANDAGRFDGVWSTTLTCSTTAGALGYSYHFTSTVKNGVLHAERLAEGQPGWLQLDGTIQPDGKATIHAKGLVGEQKHAFGQQPAGTSYAYQIVGKFTAKEGSGKRVKSRPCEVTFTKNE
jgi:hypothetical protein